MGVLETLLLLAGSVAAIGAIGLMAYRGFSTKKIIDVPTPEMTSSIVLAPTTAIQTNEETKSPEEQIQNVTVPSLAQATPTSEPQIVSVTPATPTPQSATIPIPLAAPADPIVETIPEAPEPFAEDFSPKTSVPTDVGAVANFTSPVESAFAPVLVIQAPKIKRARTSKRRLPTSAATPGTPTTSNAAPSASTNPRRRRTTRAKTGATPSPVPSPESSSPSGGANPEQQ